MSNMPEYKKILKNGTTSWISRFYYTDWNGERKQKKKEGFRTKKEAREYEIEFLSKSNPTPDIKFSTLYDLYMEHCEIVLKPTTVANKKVLFELKILPYFKDMKVDSIRTTTVKDWQHQLIKEGHAPTYLKTIHNQLSAIFNYAIQIHDFNFNPARKCGSMGEKNAPKKDFYTPDEFNQFIQAFEKKPMSKLMLEVLFWSGMRSGELLALYPSDFNFEDNVMNISKSYARLEGEDYIDRPKTTSSGRTVAIPEFLSIRLQEHIRINQIGQFDRMFPVTKSLLNIEMSRGSKESGIKKIRVHDLRHSHASLLIELGFSPIVIMERLGHKNIQTTLQTYGHMFPHKQSEIVSKLQQLNQAMENESKL